LRQLWPRRSPFGETKQIVRDPTGSCRKISLAGFVRLGHDLGSKSGSHPSTDGAGYMFYGPRLQAAQLMTSLSGVKVEWLLNLKPIPFGYGVQIALGDVRGGCRVGIERMDRAVPVGFLGGASATQIDQMRTGQMDILDVSVGCQ
jgi:hypothetical protein